MQSFYYYLVLSLMTAASVLAQQQEEGEEAATATAADDAMPLPPPLFASKKKVWYLANVQVGGVELPIDYVTLGVGFISILVLYAGLVGTSSKKALCTASHILVDNHDDATCEKMKQWQQEIGADAAAFAKLAAQHSTCPSKSKGGMLGTFPPGAMVPAFDKCCFDPKTPLQTAVGPVHTHFGYHLIFIHDRKLPEK